MYFYSSNRRPFQFTPSKKGSPNDAATLGFYLLAVRRAFLLDPKEEFETGNFQLNEKAKQWPPLVPHSPIQWHYQRKYNYGNM